MNTENLTSQEIRNLWHGFKELRNDKGYMESVYFVHSDRQSYNARVVTLERVFGRALDRHELMKILGGSAYCGGITENQQGLKAESVDYGQRFSVTVWGCD